MVWCKEVHTRSHFPSNVGLAVNKRQIATATTSFVMAVSNNSVFDATTALFVNDIIGESELVAVYDDTRRKSPKFQFWDYDKVETQRT